jgi:hypothetical protein
MVRPFEICKGAGWEYTLELKRRIIFDSLLAKLSLVEFP